MVAEGSDAWSLTEGSATSEYAWSLAAAGLSQNGYEATRLRRVAWSPGENCPAIGQVSPRPGCPLQLQNCGLGIFLLSAQPSSVGSQEAPAKSEVARARPSDSKGQQPPGLWYRYKLCIFGSRPDTRCRYRGLVTCRPCLWQWNRAATTTTNY